MTGFRIYFSACGGLFSLHCQNKNWEGVTSIVLLPRSRLYFFPSNFHCEIKGAAHAVRSRVNGQGKSYVFSEQILIRKEFVWVERVFLRIFIIIHHDIKSLNVSEPI